MQYTTTQLFCFSIYYIYIADLYKTASLHLHYFLDWLYSKRKNDNNNVQLCNQSILLTNTTHKTHFCN